MAKATKKRRAPSIHSRAARRAQPHEDSSITQDRRHGNNETRSDVLSARNPGSISKKKKDKALSRQQRQRKMKSMERAASIAEQMEVKVDKSKAKEKEIKKRRATWNELNGTVQGGPSQASTSETRTDLSRGSENESAEDEEDSETFPDPRLALVAGPIVASNNLEAGPEIDEIT